MARQKYCMCWNRQKCTTKPHRSLFPSLTRDCIMMNPSTMNNRAATPTRNTGHSSRPPVTEWIPRTPASKAAARKRRKGVSTMPRLTPSPLPMLRRHPSHGNSCRTTSSPSTGDRFIPNRAKMNMDLCSASILSAEKRRVESIGKAADRQRCKRDVDNCDDNSITPPQTPYSEPESALQAEFHRRMKAALFDIPLERLEQIQRSKIPATRNSSSNKDPTMCTIEIIVAPNLSTNNLSDENDLSYLAYVSLPELEADDDASPAPSIRRHVSETNLLSFSSNRRDNSSSSSIPDPTIMTSFMFFNDQLQNRHMETSCPWLAMMLPAMACSLL